MLLFIVAFTLQVAVVYKPVYRKSLVEVATSLTGYTSKTNGLITIFDELVFTVLGLGNRPVQLTTSELEYNPKGTYVLATVVFALYQILGTVVLINLLIAMMSRTYTVLDARSDVEWKYGRASIIRNMKKSYSMPVPANIFATLLTIVWVSYFSKCCCCIVYMDSSAKKKSRKGDEESPDSDVNSSITELSYDPEDTSAATPILHVLPWKTIVFDFKQSHGIVDSLNEYALLDQENEINETNEN